MGFRFPLATVLRHRQAVEKREEQALQRLLAEMSRVQQQIDALTTDVAGARLLLDQAMQQSLPAVHIESMMNQIESAIFRKQELLASLAELHRQREVQNRKYQLAHNDCQMLSDMEARQREAYAQERVRADQKALDDIFVRRVQRSDGGIQS